MDTSLKGRKKVEKGREKQMEKKNVHQYVVENIEPKSSAKQ